MKVCTDACLFGSILAKHIQPLPIQKILDIGTGTGLLSLMLAQKNANAIIDAVEIDEAAAMQAASNFQQSPWAHRLNIHHTSVQQYNGSNNQLYELIISNPPFYENDLKTNNAKRNIALHSNELNFEELSKAVIINLAPTGIFGVLLPCKRVDEFINLSMQKKLYLHKRIDIKQTTNHSFFRSILLLTHTQEQALHSSICIKDEKENYSLEFKELLAPFYLKL